MPHGSVDASNGVPSVDTFLDAGEVPPNFLPKPPAHEYSEQEVREQLAAAYRLTDQFACTLSTKRSDLIFNHITVRVPGEPHHFLINPFGMLFRDITASSLIKVDLSGRVVAQGSTRLGVNIPGFILHSAVHEARPDVHCVMHTHARAPTAVSTMKCGFLRISQHSHLTGHVRYHDYEGVVVSRAEKARIIADLGESARVLMLRNHGPVTMGTTVAEAFVRHYMLDQACKVQIDAMSAGGLGALVHPDPDLVARNIDTHEALFKGQYGNLEFAALTAHLDPSYRL